MRKIWITAVGAVALVLAVAAPAAAQPVQPNDGEGLISMLQRTCGTSANWRQESMRLGLAQSGPYAHWLMRGQTYDVRCGGSAAPPPASTSTTTSGWSDPLPSACGRHSSFGAPRDGGRRSHQGIDMSAGTGTAIHAAAAGTVIEVGWISNNAGNGVEIDSGNGVVSKYFHMQHWAVRLGQHVKSGQVIGYVGSTGDATGPHLHLEIWVYGELKNPGNYLAARGVNVYC